MGQRAAWRRYLTLAITFAVIACGSSTTMDLPSASPYDKQQPTFIRDGVMMRLNLLTPEAFARIAFRDPVQGEKDASGKCTFPRIEPTHTGKDLTALVGEWNVETCGGLAYWFRANPNDKPQRIYQEDTTFIDFTKPRLGVDSKAHR